MRSDYTRRNLKLCRSGGKVSLIRWMEFILCMMCICSAVLLCNSFAPITLKIIPLTISSCFLFLTLIDIVSWCILRPISYRTWVMVATAAFLLFCLCAGLLFFIESMEWLKILGIGYTMSAVMFLFDLGFMISVAIYFPEADIPHRVVTVDREMVASFDEIPITQSTSSHTKKTSQTTEAYYFTTELIDPVALEKKSTHNVKKPRKDSAPITYGGTFPVGRDLTPFVPCRSQSADKQDEITAMFSVKKKHGKYIENQGSTSGKSPMGSPRSVRKSTAIQTIFSRLPTNEEPIEETETIRYSAWAQRREKSYFLTTNVPPGEGYQEYSSRSAVEPLNEMERQLKTPRIVVKTAINYDVSKVTQTTMAFQSVDAVRTISESTASMTEEDGFSME